MLCVRVPEDVAKQQINTRECDCKKKKQRAIVLTRRISTTHFAFLRERFVGNMGRTSFPGWVRAHPIRSDHSIEFDFGREAWRPGSAAPKQ
jgi:hypothetical protein